MIREIIVVELLKHGMVDVHVEDIAEVVSECVTRRLPINIKPHSKMNDYVTVIA